MARSARQDYLDTISAAVADIADNGYDSAERLASWMSRIRAAAARAMTPQHEMERHLREALAARYRSEVERGGVASRHEGLSRFTLERIRPQLRSELDRRILASTGLIRLNRDEAVEKTLRRFAGWATSVPAGGTDVAKRRKIKDEVRKPLARLPFEERRVLIDQGHKLASSVSSVLAQQGGALAAAWKHVKQADYDARPEHLARDGTVFLVKDSWAHERGLVRPGSAGYTDNVEQPAELPFCRCYYRYLYSLGALPSEMLTNKGRRALEEAREKMAGVAA